jgi:excisionase family DNA binding protein
VTPPSAQPVSPQFAHHGDRLLYKPPEAARALGISIAYLYELLAEGQIESLKIGASRRIPAASIQQFIDAKLAETREA